MVNSGSLRTQVDALFERFSHLRRLSVWRGVKGGVRFLDLTWDARDQLWHPHLHVIIEGEVDLEPLRHEWLMLTEGADHVHVSPISTDEYRHNAAYYVSKPPQSTFHGDVAAVAEYGAALKGKRLAQPFGSWRGKPLIPRRPKAKSHQNGSSSGSILGGGASSGV